MEWIILVMVFIIVVILKELANKNSYKVKNEKGKRYESLVAKKYRDEGYEVYEKGKIEGKNDGGIDLVAKKDDLILLIQCKNWKIESKYRVREKEVREFYGASNFYIDENSLDREKVICVYVVPNDKLIALKSKGLFKKHYKRCRYRIVS